MKSEWKLRTSSAWPVRANVGRGGVGEKPLEGFAPTGPAPPNHHLISCYAPKSRYPKRTTPGNRQQSRRSPLGPDTINLRRSGPLRHPASLPAAAHATTAAQAFHQIVIRLGRGIREAVASRDPPVPHSVHEVIVFLDDLAFLVAVILAELAHPV